MKSCEKVQLVMGMWLIVLGMEFQSLAMWLVFTTVSL